MFKREKTFSVFIAVLSLMFGLSGCGDDSVSSQTAFNQTFQKKGTIQGTIFDATTGERISGTDLKLVLVQGAQHRRPSRLITNESDDLAGEYAFAGVPVELDNGNITYKMIVIKPGYQRFEGNVTLADSGAQTIAGTTDTFFNRIANVYLFPTGATAPDVKVVVEFDQEPVIGAQVRLVQNAGNNTATAEVALNANRIFPSPGLLPSLTATTVADPNGNAVATFAGSSLVLGGRYTATVLPLQREGIQLSTAATGVVNVGISTVPLVIAMASLEPGGQDDGIHIVFASNRDVDDITGLTNPGVLTLVFNRSVAVVGDLPGDTPFTATLVNPGAALLNVPGTATSVTAALSVDGLTLTLTPQFTTAPVVGDTELQVVYAGGLVTVSGDEGAQGNDVFALSLINGTVISNIVNVNGP